MCNTSRLVLGLLLLSGAAGATGWPDDDRQHPFKLAHDEDPRKEHRDRQLEETRKHLEALGIEIHKDYEQRRRLIGKIPADYDGFQRRNRRLNQKQKAKSQLLEEHDDEARRMEQEDEEAIWNSLMADTAFSMMTMSPVAAPSAAPAPAPVSPPPTAAPATSAPATSAPVTSVPVTAPSAAPVASEPPVRKPSSFSSGSPSMSPTETEECDVLCIILGVALFGGEEFENPDSYQSCALTWLENSQTSGLSAERIIQRYALASIYCATNAVKTPFTDAAFDGDDPPEWRRQEEWLTDIDECLWDNVHCNGNGLVTMIDLHANLVTGEFPPEVVLLATTLEYLDLGMNVVFTRGEFFNPYLGQLTELRDLRYESTNFLHDAGIPLEIGNLKKLEFYNCAKVRYIGALNGGAFPPDMTALTHLDIEKNSYNSTVPAEITALPALKYFYIRDSFIEGDLNWMKGMASVEEVWVDSNPGLGGQPLPTFFGNLTNLRGLSVADCGWTGGIPADLSSLDMRQMFFADNEFVDEIPVGFGSYSNLRWLDMQLNNLEGLMPLQLCSQTQVDGVLETLKGDCDNCPYDPNNPDFTCCTSCFDEEGKEVDLTTLLDKGGQA